MAPKRKAVGLASFVSMLSAPEETPTGGPSPPDTQTNGHPTTNGSGDSTVDAGDQRPTKKRKEEGLPRPGYMQYDATGLAPHYTKAVEVPERLKKYFAQRFRFFSLYADGCLLDEEGWYSVTPERIADQIADRCRCDVILDAFCGVGGNAIAFAKTCERVIALDVSPERLALARHNAAIYGVADRIEFVLCDYLEFARSYALLPPERRTIEVVFLSPPWGGPEYLSTPSKGKQKAAENDEVESQPVYSLKSVKPIPGDELFALSRKISKNVAYYLPRNVSLQEVASLAPSEKVELEEEWMGDKLKAVTCYYGGLATGQEQQF